MDVTHVEKYALHLYKYVHNVQNIWHTNNKRHGRWRWMRRISYNERCKFPQNILILQVNEDKLKSIWGSPNQHLLPSTIKVEKLTEPFRHSSD